MAEGWSVQREVGESYDAPTCGECVRKVLTWPRPFGRVLIEAAAGKNAVGEPTREPNADLWKERGSVVKCVGIVPSAQAGAT